MHGNNRKIGTFHGTGAALNISVGFQPRFVKLIKDQADPAMSKVLEWYSGMASASAFKQVNNACLAAAGLTLGSTSKKEVKITNTVTYLINGVFKSKATAETGFTATTHDITNNAASVQEACYLVSLDASGTVTLTMGTIATGAGNSLVPDCPANQCAIGYLRLAVAAGATPFNATTDDLDAAHLTDTYVDYSMLSGAEKITSNGISVYTGLGADSSNIPGWQASTAYSAGDIVQPLTPNGNFYICSSAGTSGTGEPSWPTTQRESVTDNGATWDCIGDGSEGFTLGADGDFNVNGEVVRYIAER